MYTLALNRNFSAIHYLIGGDWGEENQPHAHHYKIEVALNGNGLNSNGYLMDIVDLENSLDRLIDSYENRVLNDLPEFEGLNPSIENLSRLAHRKLCHHIDTTGLLAVSVTIWEDEKAWARFESDLK